MLCTKIVFCFCFDIQNNICAQHVVNLYFSWNSMNNLLSLTGARMRASEKDLPVTNVLTSEITSDFFCQTKRTQLLF